ncbi:1,2-dihydroxy-3-keto-5-methylthiopentene dioxygenase, partial [Varicellaria rhodocarpa]|nr:1,2-dihydroxy-3-keto-5-methylthiopentene dioxygenase [Varicellaria rhodocarpa]
MKIYYHDLLPSDPRLPHSSSSPSSPSPSTLLPTLGIHTSHHPTLTTVNTLATSRGYKNRDTITVSPASMGAAYESKIAQFFEEHMHEDEEIRYVVEGAGYFDVRSGGEAGGEGDVEGEKERWIRVRMEAGDLIVLPAGIYHRFTVDENNYIKAMRLFKDEPKWTPLNRGPEVDENPVRKEYVQALQTQTVGGA